MIFPQFIIRENQWETGLLCFFIAKIIFPTTGQAFWQVKKSETVLRETEQEGLCVKATDILRISFLQVMILLSLPETLLTTRNAARWKDLLFPPLEEPEY